MISVESQTGRCRIPLSIFDITEGSHTISRTILIRFTNRQGFTYCPQSDNTKPVGCVVCTITAGNGRLIIIRFRGIRIDGGGELDSGGALR